jgi:hypothetical protein
LHLTAARLRLSVKPKGTVGRRQVIDDVRQTWRIRHVQQSCLTSVKPATLDTGLFVTTFSCEEGSSQEGKVLGVNRASGLFLPIPLLLK